MTRPAPAAAVPLVLVTALGLDQGGFLPGAWVWAGALAAWAAALAVVLGDGGAILPRAWPWLGLAGALLAWTLASAAWSAHPAQSVLEARRTLAYVAVLLALVTLSRRGAARWLVLATFAATAFLVAYALARYLLGAHVSNGFEAYLLAEPVGYANGIAILAATGLLLALGIGAAAPAWARGATAATVPPFALAVVLAESKASWLALAAGLAAALLLDERPLRLVRLSLAVAPAAAVLSVLGRESSFTTQATPRIAGWVLVLATAACSAAAAALAHRYGTSESSRRPSTRARVAAAAVAAAAALAAVAVYSSQSQPRASYYAVAWHDQYTAHPLLGSGAGTFALYWARSGDVAAQGGALDAHSLYLETLAELGPVGLALLLATLLWPLRAAAGARRAAYVPAAAAAYTAFLVHAGLDWDWELPVVVVAGLSCAAAAVSAAHAGPSPGGRLTRAVALVAAVALGALALAGLHSKTEPAALAQQQGAPPKQGPWISPRIAADYLP